MTIAKRQCGDIAIRITLLDPNWAAPVYRTDYQYRCYIRPKGVAGTFAITVYVNPPKCGLAVDSSEAFDGVARAALAFAAAEGWPIDAYAASNDAGYVVTRKHAYPVDTPAGRCYVEGRNGGQRW